MKYWQRLRLVSLTVLAAMVLALLLLAATREPAPPATPRTNIDFGF